MANNTFAGSVSAYSLGTGGESCKTAVALDTLNTLFLHHRRSAVGVGEAEILQGNHVRMDYDLFFLNGYEPWPQHTPGILSGDVGSGYQEFPTLDDVRSSLGLEAHGAEGDPRLAGFDPSVDDGTWQDFRLTTDSALAVDKGTALPASLVSLLAKLSIDPGQKGTALDIGAIELDPDNPDAPSMDSIQVRARARREGLAVDARALALVDCRIERGRGRAPAVASPATQR